jgi:glycogen debranching enzyme
VLGLAAVPKRREGTVSHRAAATSAAGIRSVTIPRRPREIIRATELGAASVLKEGPLFLISDAFGNIAPDRRGLGLYLGDTRTLSTAVLLIEGLTPTLLRPDPGGAARGTVQLSNPNLPDDPMRSVDHPAALPRQSIGIRRVRALRRDESYRERVVVTNYTTVSQRLTMRLLLDVDGADVFEVRGYPRPRRGELPPVDVEPDGLTYRYRGLDGRELVTDIRFAERPGSIGPAAPEEPASAAVDWQLALPAGHELEASWIVRAAWSDGPPRGRSGGNGAGSDAPRIEAHDPGTAPDGHVGSERDPDAAPGPRPDAAVEPRGVAEDTEPTVDTDDKLVNLIAARALADLRLLQTPGPEPGEHFIAAGIPWFATLFGRDSLIAALGSLPFRPELARDALTVLARLQATEDDPLHDAEPGKILHELRTGEMARTGELPFARYYGSVDSTPLWLLLLAETYAWTADAALIDALWPAAMRALAWIDNAPRDDHGFIVYRTRSARGLRNQGWKDSADSVRDRHGRLLEPPIALAEVQAYVIEARRRLADLAEVRGAAELATRLRVEARDLASRFDEHFWLPDLERYAMALGPDGTVADALGSNVGHCLWSGAVPTERAGRVVRDLMGPSLFSGWGIRTFGAGQPGFNPLGYHTGTVWPHDSALATAGLKRYGFHDEASTVAWAILDAARRTPEFRLPELFCGFDRGAIEVPVIHPVACTPQAWAAAAPLLLLTTMLGLVPRASRHELEIVRPVLPKGLSKVVLRDLRVAGESVDLLFHRWRGTTSAEVLRRTGDLRVTVRL